MKGSPPSAANAFGPVLHVRLVGGRFDGLFVQRIAFGGSLGHVVLPTLVDVRGGPRRGQDAIRRGDELWIVSRTKKAQVYRCAEDGRSASWSVGATFVHVETDALDRIAGYLAIVIDGDLPTSDREEGIDHLATQSEAEAAEALALLASRGDSAGLRHDARDALSEWRLERQPLEALVGLVTEPTGRSDMAEAHDELSQGAHQTHRGGRPHA